MGVSHIDLGGTQNDMDSWNFVVGLEFLVKPKVNMNVKAC